MHQDDFRALAVVGVIFALVWICLPFAIFGIKSRLDAQTRLLRSILEELKTANAAAEADEEPDEPEAPPARRRLLIEPRATIEPAARREPTWPE